MTDDQTAAAAEAVRRHVDAFNAGDLDALLSGFTDDALWITGTSTVRGRAELTELFEGAISQLRPRLDLGELIAERDLVACQLVETLPGDTPQTFAIAGFYRLRDGLIASAKIYREGSAEIG
jgi:uncharacterized protein